MDGINLITFALLLVLSCVSYIDCLSGGGTSSKSPYNHIVLNHNHPEVKTEDNSDLPPLSGTPFSPTWPSLDARVLPPWFDKAKVGVFIHWGVFSVPGFKSEWFWWYWKGNNPDAPTLQFMKDNYPPRFTYQDFARDFTAEFYNPTDWASIIKRSGAKYIVLTSKHHDGYALWPSKYSFGWNTNVGPNRDLLGDLAAAIRNNTDIKFGIYHSWFEWFNPLYISDRDNGYNTSTFVDQKAYPELQELVSKYKPEVIWSDGDWETTPEYWKSKEFLAWLYNSSPVKDTVVVNDRWGTGTSCKHGGFFSCQDHYNPGHVLPYKWENAMTIDKDSWGFRRNADALDYRSLKELIFELVTTVSCGGNFLINIGPTRDGMIAPILELRLLEIGQWLGINGDAIYETSPWNIAQNDSISPGVWYTEKSSERKLFAIILEDSWPEPDEADDKSRIVLGALDQEIIGRIKNISMLGLKGARNLYWKSCSSTPSKSLRSLRKCPKGIQVTLPNLRSASNQSGGWTLVINLN